MGVRAHAAGLAVFGLFLLAAGFAVGSTVQHGYSVTIDPTAEQAAAEGTAGVQSCGSERAAVKHLTDGFVLPATPIVMTPDQLVALAAPAVGSSSPRFATVPAGSLPETTLVELKNVHVIAVKQEADSDLHVIVSTATGAELNVEAPMAACDSSSAYAAVLAKARAAMDAAMPNPSSSAYTAVNLTATIEGVLFWDVLHGQRGAPNGVELHPVTFFSVGGVAPPPPPPPATTTAVPPPITTAPTTTAQTTTSTGDDAIDELPGCVQYPRRIYFQHVRQNHCAANYFLTPQ